MDRRSLLTGAPALAACAALPRDAFANAGLIGLPLAAEYGRLAAQAMAHPGIGSLWEMAILSGDANQQFGFAQIGYHPLSLVRHRAGQLRYAMGKAYGYDYAVTAPDETGIGLVRVAVRRTT